MEIQPRQLRAARADLNISLKDVSDEIKVSSATISDIEQAKTDNPRYSTMNALRLFYEARGIQFLDNGGVAPRHVQIEQYHGAEGFRAFMNDVYEVAKDKGGAIRLHNAKPSNWTKWLGEEWNKMHTQRMLDIDKKLDFRITAGHGDHQFIGKHAEYRWLPKEMWNEQSFYTYGDRHALLTFGEDSVDIVVVHNIGIVKGFQALFDLAWEKATITPDGV